VGDASIVTDGVLMRRYKRFQKLIKKSLHENHRKFFRLSKVNMKLKR
jgi:hypothetical protein